MAIIRIQDLSFHYEGSPHNIFTHTTFAMDTDWRLGFIARNGRGKTTLLRLLCGLETPSSGAIQTSVRFSLFPFEPQDTALSALEVARDCIAPFREWERVMALTQDDPARAEEYIAALTHYIEEDGYTVSARLTAEAMKLELSQELLARPYRTLSHGERTRLMLAALFLRRNNFLLIDEPTNHLDMAGRALLSRYLASKQGFLLVSHDRALLNSCIDHVVSITRSGTVTVEKGNYTSWQNNAELRESFERDENERLLKDIGRLQTSMASITGWSDAVEKSKIGGHAPDRGAIGAKSAKMMRRAKAVEGRIQREMSQKETLLHDVEESTALKLFPLTYEKKRVVAAEDFTVDYGAGALFTPVTFELCPGDRLWLTGRNGCGKSSLIKALLGESIPHTGRLAAAQSITVSYVDQDTSFLTGTAADFAESKGIELSLLLGMLRRLGFEREQMFHPMEGFSQGQKKKVLLAASLSTPAHLYVWDEPLNYIDLISRVQIEALLATYCPTMLFVEHDRAFGENVATKTVALG